MKVFFRGYIIPNRMDNSAKYPVGLISIFGVPKFFGYLLHKLISFLDVSFKCKCHNICFLIKKDNIEIDLFALLPLFITI